MTGLGRVRRPHGRGLRGLWMLRWQHRYRRRLARLDEEEELLYAPEALSDWSFSLWDRELVDDALDQTRASQHPEQVLCCQFGVDLRRKDLVRLAPEVWLNDEVINCYFRILQSRGMLKCYCPSSFFWPKLEAGGHTAVQRWAKRAGVCVQELDAMLLPLHLHGDHWSLGVVDFRQRGFHYYDPLNYEPPRNLVVCLNEFIEGECQAGPWELIPCSHRLPRQRNMADCGIFTCAYAERFSAGAPVSFPNDEMSINRMRRAVAAAVLRGRL